MSFVAVVVQLGVVVRGSPLLVGVMRQVRAKLEGRAGPGVLQPWRDLRKLLRKERITPRGTSEVFRFAPVLLMATTLVVAVVAPFATTSPALDPAGDLFAVVALLTLGAVMLALAGIDTGTAFGGMGASREMTIIALVEPTLLVAIFALSARVGSINLGDIIAATINDPALVISPVSLLAAVALALAIIAEAGRLPVDNCQCGSRLMVNHAKNRHGETYPYVVCLGRHSKRNTCTRQAILVSAVERLVEDHYKNIELSPEASDALAGMIEDIFERINIESETERRDLNRQAERLEDEQMKLLQAHYAGAIPIPLLKKEQDRIGEHLEQINRRLNAYQADYAEAKTKLRAYLKLATNTHASTPPATSTTAGCSTKRSSPRSPSPNAIPWSPSTRVSMNRPRPDHPPARRPLAAHRTAPSRHRPGQRRSNPARH